MIDPNDFDKSLRQLLQKDAFVPFYVHLDDGQRILIRHPVLAFGGGSASFIDDEDGVLVGFTHDEVKGFYTTAQEVEA